MNTGLRLRSGKVIPTVNATKAVHSRTWQSPVLPPNSNIEDNDDPPVNTLHLIGEAMYIAKPIILLSAFYCFKSSQWMPWLISLGLDTASLQLLKHQDGRKFSRRQSLEISRRNCSLLFYILRSPFYEKHTREKLNKTLLTLSDILPLVGVVLRPLSQFIPKWQELIFQCGLLNILVIIVLYSSV